MSRVLQYIANTPWAITQEELENICAIAERVNDEQGLIRAIQREEGDPLPTPGKAQMLEGGVAVIPVTGPLFRRANLFTRISGATSLEIVANTIGEALADPAVNSIILVIDSPGGEVNGTHELSELIFSAREEKPLTVFVPDRAQSGALWISSAASEVVVAATARLGSLGVVYGVVQYKDSGDVRRLEIVSSNAPKKRLDPFTREGEEDLLTQVDAIEAVFITAMGRNRGVSEETVVSDFGQGGSFVGQAAVDAGLADRLGTLEAVIQEHQEHNRHPRIGGVQRPAAGGDSNPQAGETAMEDEGEGTPAAKQPVIDRAFLNENHSEIVASILGEGRTAGAEAERERILAISAITAPGFEELKSELIQDPNCSAGDAALRVLNAQGEQATAQGQAHIDALKATEKELDAPDPAVTGDADEASTEVAAIMGAGQPKAALPADNKEV